MQFRFTFFLFFSLLLLVGCDREDVDFPPTVTTGALPPTDSLTSSTSLAGIVTNPDGTFPSNATVEILYGDFVIHSQTVNSGDGSWFFDDIAVGEDPNVLVRVNSPGWVPAIRSIPNRSDVVQYANFELLERGPVEPVNQTSDHTITNGLLSVTIPANGYEPYAPNVGIQVSLDAYSGTDINSLGNAIAAPLLVEEGGDLRALTDPTVYVLDVTAGSSLRVGFNKSLDRGITLSTSIAGPNSIIYVLNQKTGYWENISTPDGFLEIKQFGYIAVAQQRNSVRVTGRIEAPDGTGISGGDVYGFVTDANGSNAFSLTATDGNGDYELLIPEGSSGVIYVNPLGCDEEFYNIEQQSSDLDLGVFTVTPTNTALIEGVVDGCTPGIPSTQDLALSVSSGTFSEMLVPVDTDGSFSFTAEVCPEEAISFVPVVQSGPSEGRRGDQVTLTGSDPLTNLTFSFCDSVVTQELIFLSFGPTYAFTTDVSASVIHSDTIEILGGDMRWLFALNSQKVSVDFEDANYLYSTNEYVEVKDFIYDGIKLQFGFEDAEGTRTEVFSGSSESIESFGGVTVKVD